MLTSEKTLNELELHVDEAVKLGYELHNCLISTLDLSNLLTDYRTLTAERDAAQKENRLILGLAKQILALNDFSALNAAVDAALSAARE